MVSSLYAEDAKTDSMPDQVTPEATPTAEPTPAADADNSSSGAKPPVHYTEPLPLIPETPDQFPKSSGRRGGDSQESVASAREKLKHSKEAAAADELKERIRFREVKTRALKDGRVQAQWEQVQTANTIPDKQAAMKQYYNVLFAKILQMDGSLKARVAKLKQDALERLEKPELASLNPAVHGKTW
jgi:hypothetical protein